MNLLAQTQALIAAHSQLLNDAVALGHSLGQAAATVEERVAAASHAATAAASQDGAAAVKAIEEAIGPNGVLTQQLQAWHAQWAGTSAPAAPAAPAAAAPAQTVL